MNLTILKVSDILSDITIDKNSIIKIIENNKVELLGQFTNDNNKIDPNKISHIYIVTSDEEAEIAKLKKSLQGFKQSKIYYE